MVGQWPGQGFALRRAIAAWGLENGMRHGRRCLQRRRALQRGRTASRRRSRGLFKPTNIPVPSKELPPLYSHLPMKVHNAAMLRKHSYRLSSSFPECLQLNVPFFKAESVAILPIEHDISFQFAEQWWRREVTCCGAAYCSTQMPGIPCH